MSIDDSQRRSRPLSSSSTRSSGPRSPSPPSQTYHPSGIIPKMPTPALVESVAGAAHYSGANVGTDTLTKRHSTSGPRQSESHTQLHSDHQRVLDDLKEMFCARTTLDILDRTWSKDAVFEVWPTWADSRAYQSMIPLGSSLPLHWLF